MTTTSRVLPTDLVHMIELFVDEEHINAAKYENRELLDGGGVYVLYELAAKVYATGFSDGARAEAIRLQGVRRRQADAKRRTEDVA